ncbi:MAG: hypothetical protein A2487_12650 [Candidatus Raymondbacteria bacterium RifOxyC12_full_50_8]|uniref:PorV/PorQ family protein n=1 Tax=Candidatus Raymondbacteria bacterium RIFOXYD12_FULL_49_13 TaxID=1817890 RepID=A0A1F7FCB2_UNCRA|nr:MAG: hypothetical protein A2248_03110 [Candidatus Raymondbacteria bacterium RIFOXYA2_FULL_49_16]OGJ93468.1 MAG: hypothetical protein A2350_19030 [Candidatus Raymondbacteria bacterium RifOxyB12_full_50_8]OGK04273.1 MAG: hypothetical protein A2519_18095 [Candidatus Raymondbacteria bacterium RIFOXYD12_FULL_49_13]OGK07969.1 MAG: hypothetical protein A2487_12650 [Candidatus Raymondbacteria bacterium RifOxyC12_full_50_8]OGP42444.1 MAG: hypothetical protein A2324_17145 [Candidatus Raymondbacteria b
MKNIFLFCVALFAAYVPGSTIRSSEYEYLPQGARSDAMGGIGCASSRDAYCQFYNPALMALSKNIQCNVEYTPIWNLGDDFTTGSAVLPLKNDLAFGIAYSRLEINGIPYFDELDGSSFQDRKDNLAYRSTGRPLGSFSTVYDLAGFSIAKWYRTTFSREAFYKLTIPVCLSFGAKIKFYRQSFYFPSSLKQQDFEGHASDMDGGMLLRFTIDRDLATGKETKVFTAGYSIKNILKSNVAYNTDRKYEDSGERIRTLGFAYQQEITLLRGSIVAAVDLLKRWYETQTYRYGVEYGYKNLLFIRSGWCDGSWSAGAGFSYKWITVDYSFRQHELSATPYRIGLGLTF